MTFEKRSIAISSTDSVSALLATPAAPRRSRAVVVLAHGAGNDMSNPFLSAVHEGLCERGFATLKFNFPYKERGGRAPDKTAVLEACYRSVLESMRSDRELRDLPVIIGGKSMGGRMATHLAAQGEAVAGVLLLGYPLHPAGKPEQLRDAHLNRITAPMLFFAGTRDALCSLDLLRPALAACTAPVTLHVIEGGDHSFKVLKRSGRDQAAVEAEIVDASAAWLRAAIG